MRSIGALVIVIALLCPSKALADDYVRVTQNGVNVRTGPSTNSTVIATAKEGDVFEAFGRFGEWVRVFLFSGEGRYIHSSLTQVTSEVPPMPAAEATRRSACIEIVRAQDRAAAEANKRHLSDEMKITDYERLLYDRYQLPIFQKYGIAPAHGGKLGLDCVQKGWLP